MHRVDLGLYSHPKEVWGNGVRTHVNSKGKNPLYRRLRGASNPRRCITKDNKPSTLPIELSLPPSPPPPTLPPSHPSAFAWDAVCGKIDPRYPRSSHTTGQEIALQWLLCQVIIIIALGPYWSIGRVRELPPLWPSGKASSSRAEGPGSEFRLRQDFYGVESYQ